MLVLVRHGEATANAAGLLLGRSDVPLTEKGFRQVAALRGHLGMVARVVSSPLRRARDTAEALDLGLPIEVDRRWVEVDYGAHEGQALTAVPAEVWRHWRADPDFHPPGGESLADVGRRVRAACEELFADRGGPPDAGRARPGPGGSAGGSTRDSTRDSAAGPVVDDPAVGGARSTGGDVVVVSHVSPIKAAVAWALETGDEVAWRLHLSTGSVTRIGWGVAGPLVHCFNWSPDAGHPAQPPR
ncbi:MAG: histidine phosphatase family protein [Acidimicrobiales bacterium]